MENSDAIFTGLCRDCRMSRLRAASLGSILSFALLLAPDAGCSRTSTTKSPSASRSDSSLRSSTRVQQQGDEEPTIRVMLIERAAELRLAVAGPYEVRQKNRILAQGSNLRKIRVTTVEGQPQRLQIGQLACPPGPIEIVPRTPGTLRLYFNPPQRAAFSRLYEGYARISCRPPETDAAPNSGGIDFVNVITLEEYLPSVLQAELYADWHIEAYRAQAVAARTYALYEMRTFGKKRNYDVRATEASQVYRGIDDQGHSKKALRAVRNTRGIVCTWASPLGARIFSTYYSSACGGLTQDAGNVFKGASIPPLAGGAKCSYCNIGGRVYRWEPVRIGKDELTQLFVKRFPQHAGLGTIRTIEVLRSTADGRPLTPRLRGENGQPITVDSYAFRLAIGGHRLPSNHCKIVDLGSSFEFREGRGFGHAVGLCQWGTEGQARLGKKASEILSFYYPGSRLKRAY